MLEIEERMQTHTTHMIQEKRQCPGETVRCQAEDPDVLTLVPGFVAALTGLYDEMQRLWRERRLEDLRRMLRGITGASGLFGFPELKDQAMRAEERLLQQNLEEARVEVEAMAHMMRRVEGFGREWR